MGKNQKGTTFEGIRYFMPAIWGVPHKGAKSEVADTWADWIRNPCRPGGARPEYKNRSWLHVGGFATLRLLFGGSPSRGQNKKGTTCGRFGYITPAVWGVPNKRTKSELPHTWADWLHQRRSLGSPQQGDKIRRSPSVGGLATSPLPSGGVPNKRTKSERDHM